MGGKNDISPTRIKSSYFARGPPAIRGWRRAKFERLMHSAISSPLPFASALVHVNWMQIPLHPKFHREASIVDIRCRLMSLAVDTPMLISIAHACPSLMAVLRRACICTNLFAPLFSFSRARVHISEEALPMVPYHGRSYYRPPTCRFGMDSSRGSIIRIFQEVP